MVCSGAPCGPRCGGGYGGSGSHGGADGGRGTLVAWTPAAHYEIEAGKVSFVSSGPSMKEHGDLEVCCRCVPLCLSECCPSHGFGHGGRFGNSGYRGSNGGGVEITLEDQTCSVILPAAKMCSNMHCGETCVTYCDSYCKAN